jgi:hypothetical protein
VAALEDQPALGFEGRHAAGAGGGDRLAEDLVLHVAGGKDAGNGGRRRIRQGHEIAIGVDFQHALEQAGVG